MSNHDAVMYSKERRRCPYAFVVYSSNINFVIIPRMNQLKVIGILVIVILLVLFGYSRLSQPASVDNLADDAAETTLPDTMSEQEVSTFNFSTSSPSTTTMTDQTENTRVTLKTTEGDITIELFTKDMPITAGNFLTLAQKDYYDGIKFHRVIDGFMIQGGDPLTKDDSMQARWGTGGPGYAIEDEFVAGLSNVRGTISMANSGPNSGGSQFFINLVDNTNLDFDKQPLTSKHPVFGKVVSGMDVVEAIGKTPTSGPGNTPVTPVVINDVVVES